jgi:hypothetical protein
MLALSDIQRRLRTNHLAQQFSAHQGTSSVDKSQMTARKQTPAALGGSAARTGGSIVEIRAPRPDRGLVLQDQKQLVTLLAVDVIEAVVTKPGTHHRVVATADRGVALRRLHGLSATNLQRAADSEAIRP